MFKTSDIVLAATLRVKGYALTAVETTGSRGIFVFEGVDDSILDHFNLGEVVVEPNIFHQSVKQLTALARRKCNEQYSR